MTYRDKLKIDHPDYVNKKFTGGCYDCPITFYENAKIPEKCEWNFCNEEMCQECWDQEVEEE